MNQRIALICASALAAALVGVASLVVFFHVSGGVGYIAGFADELFVLAIVPTMVAACVSSAWVSASKEFGRRGALANSLRISLLAFPILFLALWATIWVWLQFQHYLPGHERPGTLEAMADTAAVYSFIAFAVGVMPAVFIEYFVIRFVRKHWFPAFPTGVAP